MKGSVVAISVSIEGNAWNSATRWATATIWSTTPLLKTSSSRHLSHRPCRLVIFPKFKMGVHDYNSYTQLHNYRCFQINTVLTLLLRATRWHCATNRKVSGSILDGVVGIFRWHNPSGRTVALRSTQPLTEMSTSNISFGGKDGRCVGLTLPPSCADCLEMWEPQPAGTLRVCPGL